MRKLRFVNGNGTEIDLTSYPFGITTWDGFSNVDLEIQSQKVPFTDGSVYLDSLLNERDLSVTLAINDEKDLSVRYELEDTVRKVLNPKLGEGYLYYQNDYLQRRIKVIPKVPLFPTHNANDSGTVKASLSFTACSPYWEDVEETTVTINSYEQETITNNGDVPCSVQLEGVNTNSPFRLFNNTSGKKIATKDDIALSLRLNTGLGEKSFEKGSFEKVFENGIMNVPYSITFNPITNQYVMLTDNGIWVSDDEENWYLKNENYSGSGFVFYDEDNNYYIVGVGTTIYTTEDLINLTQVATVSDDCNRIWKIDGMYIVNAFAFIYYGTDLSSLSLVDNSELSFTAFEKNDSVYVIGKNYTHIYSSGSWTSTSHGMTVTDACNNGDYVVIQTSDGLFYSNDYTTWIQITSDTSTKNPIYSSLLEKWIYTDSITLYSSNDLSSWETQSIDWGGVDLLFIETRENRELIFVQNPSSSYSASVGIKQIKTTDLTNFTISNIGHYFSDGAYSCMTKDENSLYLTIGREYGGKCFIYKKTTSLELITTFANIYLNGFKYIAETNKFLILSGANATVYVSEDLENWDTYSVSAYNVTYANGQYVFVGYNGTITITTDFTDIQTYSFLNTNNLYNINYCNGYYYIISDSGIAYSTDAITWVWLYQVSLVFGSNPNVFCVSDNKLYVVRINSVIVVDGLNYSIISFTQDTNYYRIFYSDIYNCFILVGSSESYITTDFQNAYTLSFAFTSLEEFENEIYIASNALCFSLEIDTENAISDLTTDSDMTLGLEVGENKLTITGQIDGVYYLTYRQKYLGV